MAHRKAGPGFWEFLNYQPYEILVNITHYRSTYKYVTQYEHYIIAYDPIKGWRVSHDITITKTPILEKYSNIIYNQEIFEKVVKKIFDESEN